MRFTMRSVARGIALTGGLLLLSLSDGAGAHGGGLNAEGCHTNRKTGDYHCHRAPAPRRAAPTPLPAPGLPAAGKCGTKLYCTQMATCSEAMFFFSQCGLARLDGDRDGVPCDDLCQ